MATATAEAGEVSDSLLSEGGESESEVRKKVQILIKNVDESYMDLGRLLFRVHAGRYWSDWGFDDFGAYVSEELGFEERKAKYLLAIWKRFRVDLGVPASKLKRIGWSKAKEILPVVDEKNFEEWLDKARTMKVRDLQKAVQKKRGKGSKSKEGETFHSLNLKFSDDQWSNVETAMEQAAADAGSDKKGHLIDLICTEYLSSKIPAGKKLPWMLKNLQRSFPDVEVIALKKNPYLDKKRVEALIQAELAEQTKKKAEKADSGKKDEPEPEKPVRPKPVPNEDGSYTMAPKEKKKKSTDGASKVKVKKKKAKAPPPPPPTMAASETLEEIGV